MTALEKKDTDDDGAVRYGPELTPAVWKDIQGYCDLVVHTETELLGEDDMYQGLMRPYGKFVAKDSFGLFPRYLVTPSFDRLVAYASEELTRETDSIQAAVREAKLRLDEGLKRGQPRPTTEDSIAADIDDATQVKNVTAGTAA
jgi:hypothetical protein